VQRLLFENSLRHALEREEFRLCYHPLLDARTNQVVSCEALIRWQHPELGLLLPDSFIPLSEETGLIIPIGEWVLRSACQQHQLWRRAGFPAVRIAVNISACQFSRGNLLATIERILSETGTEPNYLELELTESMLMQAPEEARETLNKLKALGVHLAIDDFGTGYSSLSYLKLFPIDRLKIPREFVRDITCNADDATIAKAIVSLGNNLNMRVVAEGVERIDQLEFLVSHGCDELQGFYFAQPMSSDEFGEFLSQIRTAPCDAEAKPLP
jgi:EAL domain-containing protein (putative c-di-GMP-specific phosphodiesterase class I)